MYNDERAEKANNLRDIAIRIAQQLGVQPENRMDISNVTMRISRNGVHATVSLKVSQYFPMVQRDE